MRGVPIRCVSCSTGGCLRAKLKYYFASSLHLRGDVEESLRGPEYNTGCIDTEDYKGTPNFSHELVHVNFPNFLWNFWSYTSNPFAGLYVLQKSLSRQEFMWKSVFTINTNQSIKLIWSAQHTISISFLERFCSFRRKHLILHSLNCMKAEYSTCNFEKHFIQLHKLIPHKEVPKMWFITCICPYCNSSNSLLRHMTSSITNKCYQRASPLLSVQVWTLQKKDKVSKCILAEIEYYIQSHKFKIVTSLISVCLHKKKLFQSKFNRPFPIDVWARSVQVWTDMHWSHGDPSSSLCPVNGRTDRLTDAIENITFWQLRMRAVTLTKSVV